MCRIYICMMFDIDRRRRDIALGDGEFFSPSREKREDEKVDESQRSAQLFGFFAVVRVEICSYIGMDRLIRSVLSASKDLPCRSSWSSVKLRYHEDSWPRKWNAPRSICHNRFHWARDGRVYLSVRFGAHLLSWTEDFQDSSANGRKNVEISVRIRTNRWTKRHSVISYRDARSI